MERIIQLIKEDNNCVQALAQAQEMINLALKRGQNSSPMEIVEVYKPIYRLLQSNEDLCPVHLRRDVLVDLQDKFRRGLVK